MANKRGIITSSYVFISISFLIFVLLNYIAIRGFAQTQTEQKTTSALNNTQPGISDHIFTTLRKDNAYMIYNGT